MKQEGMLLRMEEIFEKISLTMVDSDNKLLNIFQKFSRQNFIQFSLSLFFFLPPLNFIAQKITSINYVRRLPHIIWNR